MKKIEIVLVVSIWILPLLGTQELMRQGRYSDAVVMFGFFLILLGIGLFGMFVDCK